MKCPCCPRGEITLHRICDTCGIAVARGALDTTDTPRRYPRRRQDQGELRPLGDYAATKEDKQ